VVLSNLYLCIPRRKHDIKCFKQYSKVHCLITILKRDLLLFSFVLLPRIRLNVPLRFTDQMGCYSLQYIYSRIWAELVIIPLYLLSTLYSCEEAMQKPSSWKGGPRILLRKTFLFQTFCWENFLVPKYQKCCHLLQLSTVIAVMKIYALLELDTTYSQKNSD